MWRQRALLRLSTAAISSSHHQRPRWFSTAAKTRRFAALWGNGDYGRLGLGSLESQWIPTACPFFDRDPPVSVACGGAHTLFLTESGRVYAVGLNNYGQLGISPEKGHTLEPVEVVGLPEKVAQISAGYHHSSAISGLKQRDI